MLTWIDLEWIAGNLNAKNYKNKLHINNTKTVRLAVYGAGQKSRDSDNAELE